MGISAEGRPVTATGINSNWIADARLAETQNTPTLPGSCASSGRSPASRARGETGLSALLAWTGTRRLQREDGLGRLVDGGPDRRNAPGIS
jgi:hypothetical protein